MGALYSLLMDPTMSDMSATCEFVSTFQFRRDAQTSEMMPTTAGGAIVKTLEVVTETGTVDC